MKIAPSSSSLLLATVAVLSPALLLLCCAATNDDGVQVGGAHSPLSTTTSLMVSIAKQRATLAAEAEMHRSLIATTTKEAKATSTTTTSKQTPSFLSFQPNPKSAGSATAFLRSSNNHNHNNYNHQNRGLNFGPLGGVGASAESCDSAFLKCMTVPSCVKCFAELQDNSVDWATVNPDTPCDDVVKYLNTVGHCTGLTGAGDTSEATQQAEKAFCSTFGACVVWDNDDDYSSNSKGNNNNNPYNADDDDMTRIFDDDSFFMDCNELTECKWEGIHASFLGNGICNDFSCYNTAICGYDGGDCCGDTCQTKSSFVECGHDGFYCKDPQSTNCDTELTSDCKIPARNSTKPADKPERKECAEGTTPYRLIMYDSFGDGWDDTKITVSPKKPDGSVVDAPLFTGGLVNGSQGTEYICLSKLPACYHAGVKGGHWGNEVSWEVKPMTEGAPAIAGGGAPMDCNFASAGGTCEHTCTGKPNISPNDDPEYKDLKQIYACIEKKCIIQVGTCQKDEVCQKCFQDVPEQYCYGNDPFNAIVDCSLCNCMDDDKDRSFCESKTSPSGGSSIPNKKPAGGGATSKECSPVETLQGGNAVMAFGNCTNFDQIAMMITDFDQNNFGDLDKFEACAHSYAKVEKHGGHTAMGCLQVLVNAMNTPYNPSNATVPTEAIKALAELLYHNAQDFCDCAKKASDLCPFCTSFIKFKTLLYESLDACQSLDEIDCDAWNEYYPICLKNMNTKYGTSFDFSAQEQCDYLHDGCGGAGPFPSFRRLDCGNELPKESWDFYTKFATACVKDFKPSVPGTVPAPLPSAATTAPTELDGGGESGTVTTTEPRPAPQPYVPPPSGGSGKPYVPPEERGGSTPSSSSSSTSQADAVTPPRKKSRWFWNFLLFCACAGGAYYVYKRRAEGFDFIRYRRMRNNFMMGGRGGGGMDDSDMYSGLALESSTNFEPPRLPPTPAALGGSEMFQ